MTDSKDQIIERLQQRLTAADERADILFSALLAPEYLAPGCWVTAAQEGEWFKWNSDSRPINKHALCDVILRDGRILLNRSPYDFDWSRGGEVLIARQCVGVDDE